MTIAGICAKLKTICDGVTAVTSDSVTLTIKAYDPPPASLDSVKLPAVYFFTGAAKYQDDYGADEIGITREYEMHCAVLAENAATPEIREKHSRPLLDALRAQLLKYPSLQHEAGLQTMIPASDGGIVILSEYGGLYVGFIISINTLEIVSRTYAASE